MLIFCDKCVSFILDKKIKSKAFPLHAMEALGGEQV
jgi:hypothetical protein